MNEQRATEILDGALRKLLTPAGLDFYVILRQQYLEERARLDHLSLREQHRGAAELWGVLSRKVDSLFAWARVRTSPETCPVTPPPSHSALPGP